MPLKINITEHDELWLSKEQFEILEQIIKIEERKDKIQKIRYKLNENSINN